MHLLTEAKKTDDIEAILRDKMDEIQALIDAMAAEEENCDVKLAELLEGEPEQVRVAIVEKLREMLRERASEKEQELNKHLDAQKKVEAGRQRNVFMQWLAWIMSEETLRKIRVAFMSAPGLESVVKNIGQELAAKGVLTQLTDKRELGGLSNNAPNLQQGQGRGGDKGR